MNLTLYVKNIFYLKNNCLVLFLLKNCFFCISFALLIPFNALGAEVFSFFKKPKEANPEVLVSGLNLKLTNDGDFDRAITPYLSRVLKLTDANFEFSAGAVKLSDNKGDVKSNGVIVSNHEGKELFWLANGTSGNRLLVLTSLDGNGLIKGSFDLKFKINEATINQVILMDAFAASDTRLLLVVKEVKITPGAQLYVLNLSTGETTWLDTIDHDSQTMGGSYFSYLDSEGGVRFVKYGIGRIRLSADRYVNNEQKLIMFSRKKPDGLLLLKINNQVGQILDFQFKEKKLLIKTGQIFDKKIPISFWELNLSNLSEVN